MSEHNNRSTTHSRESDVMTRRMFIKGVSTSFGALPVFAWPRWAQAFYYNLGFFKKGGQGSAAYVEDVFSTYVYAGNGTTQTISNGIALLSTATGGTSVGQQAYTTPGNYSWTCPNGVSSVCVVCIGGGAGGSVNAGGDSTFTVGATVVKGGGGGSSPGVGSGGDANYSGGSSGGSSSYYSGGGGAAGYAGNGGNGNQGGGTFSAPTGGGGAGGDSISIYGGNGGSGRTGGGGVGIFGLGSNATGYGRGGSSGADGATSGTGTGGAYGGAGGNTGANTNPPGCGGGLAYKNNISVVPGTTYTVVVGAGGASAVGNGAGGSGAVRIIWGAGRSFPSTLTADQTTVNNNDAVVIAQSGLVWIKAMDQAYSHRLLDTARNALGNRLSSDTTGAQVVNNPSTGLATPLANGFSLGTNSAGQEINNSGVKFGSWTFRKAAKFFDVVTWSGDGAAGTRSISHSLGATVGMVIAKRTDSPDSWYVYHRSLSDNSGNPYFMLLNSTAGQDTGGGAFGTPTTSAFLVRSALNTSGASYVAYVYAHDTSADSLIQCGTYTGSGGVDSVTLGWEPQFVLMKNTTTGQWSIEDVMRDMNHSGQKQMQPNASGTDVSQSAYVIPNATGFTVNPSYYGTGTPVIYVAIRRGPMKVPTDATTVFKPVNYVGGTGVSSDKITTGFPVDMVITQWRQAFGAYAQAKNRVTDRLRGKAPYLSTQSAAAQDSASAFTSFDMDGLTFDNFYTVQIEGSNPNYINYCFRRAPGFFDMVCYTGTGIAKAEAHKLGVAPELMIVRPRNRAATNWAVFHSGLATTAGEYLILNSSSAKVTSSGAFNNTTPTATNFSVGVNWETNGDSSTTYVAYLFASCPGVSKIGTFTGAATDVTVPCGFSGQPRFTLVKRTDVSGYDWIVVDSARGTSVYLALNSVGSENSGTVITFTTGGFIAKAGTAANATAGATYIFMAIA